MCCIPWGHKGLDMIEHSTHALTQESRVLMISSLFSLDHINTPGGTGWGDGSCHRSFAEAWKFSFTARM